MTSLFFCSIKDISYKDVLYRFYDTIPSAFQNEISKYGSNKYALQHLVGRLVLSFSLSECGYINASLNVWNLPKGAHGKPSLPAGPHFNISHDDNHVVVAISESCPVGVDIEKVSTKDISRFKVRIFSDLEWLQIVSTKNQMATFHQFWTGKEAAMKADGRGVSMSWRNVEIVDSVAGLCDCKDSYFLVYFDCIPEYSICMASRVISESIQTKCVDVLSGEITNC